MCFCALAGKNGGYLYNLFSVVNDGRQRGDNTWVRVFIWNFSLRGGVNRSTDRRIW